MASRTEVERLQSRKARLIKQNDLYRRNLSGEVDTLRQGAALLDQGVAFYKAAGRLKQFISPFSSARSPKKQSGVSKILSGCAYGLKIWKNFRSR